MALLVEESHFRSSLPLLSEDTRGASRAVTVPSGPVPILYPRAPRGVNLVMRSWLCPAEEHPEPAPLRFVSKSDEPYFKLEAAEPQPAGACYLLEDTIETWRLEEGEYDYHVRWTPPEGQEALEGRVSFEVAPPDPDAPTPPLGEGESDPTAGLHPASDRAAPAS
jgi:hypothetical protein